MSKITKELIGHRILAKGPYYTDRPHEVVVVEFSPSEKHVKLRVANHPQYKNFSYWEESDRSTLIEDLGVWTDLEGIKEMQNKFCSVRGNSTGDPLPNQPIFTC